MPAFEDYLNRNHNHAPALWTHSGYKTLRGFFLAFLRERVRVPTFRAVVGTQHFTTFQSSVDTATEAARVAFDTVTSLPATVIACNNYVNALDIALSAAEGQGGILLTLPPRPISDPGSRATVFNPNTAADFVRVGVWVVRAGRNNTLAATEVGNQTDAVSWSRDSPQTKRAFTTETIGIVTTALGAFQRLLPRGATAIEVEPSVDDKRHAEDSWFAAHQGALMALVPDAANIIRLEILVTVSMCERCRNHYLKYVRRLFGEVPIFIYTFRDDVMPQRAGPTASMQARKQTVWEVIADAEIKYRGVWATDGTTTHDAYVYKY